MQIRKGIKGDPVNHYYNGKCKLDVVSERCTGEEWINKLMSLAIKNLLTLRIMCAASRTKILFCLSYLGFMFTIFLIIICLLLNCSSWLYGHSQFHYQLWALTLSFYFSVMSYIFNLLKGWICGYENWEKIYVLHLLIPECLTIPFKTGSYWCW